MTISADKKLWTDQEVLRLPRDGQEREIVNGELVVSPAGSEHGIIVMRIAGPLFVHVKAKRLGEVFDSQTGFRMQSDDLFSPDVSFLPTARWTAHHKTKKTFFPGAPDLAVEVLSPGDTIGVTEEKIAQYFANGTRLAWVIHPRTRSAHIYHSPIADKILRIQDSLDGEAVVPGFSLPLVEIFP